MSGRKLGLLHQREGAFPRLFGAQRRLLACRRIILLIASVFAQPALAGYQSQEALAARIETLGAHETDDRRHAVEISDCEVTTFVWENWKDHGKVLWSSFAFNLAIIQPPSVARPFEEQFLEVPFQDTTTGFVFFATKAGTTARHEVAMRRDPKPPFKLSPREGVDSYVFRESTSFMIIHKNTEPGRPKAFLEALFRYQREFCLPIG